MKIYVIVARTLLGDIENEFYGAYLTMDEAETACDKLNAKCEEDIYGYISTELHVDWNKMFHLIHQGKNNQ